MTTSNEIELNLKIRFNTDGDFGFNDENALFDKSCDFYKGAKIRYRHKQIDQTISFRLFARGDAVACRRAAEDLLENLICNIRTSRYYIVNMLCKFLIPAIDELGFTTKEIDYRDSLQGNYEGTFLNLDVKRGAFNG